MRANSLFALAAACCVAGVQAIPKISTKGSKFFLDSGEQYFVKGVAYQLLPTDPLLDTAQCTLDANLMQTLGANAIRVYHVDPSQDHSGCMSAFADVGIYLFLDLDTFDTQITQATPQWTQRQESAFEAVLDEFQRYDNLAGFFIGNEVLTDGAHSEAAVLVKAAVRDLKNYRDSKNYRAIPIGYSHADIASLRPNLQNYLACGSDPSESIDFFGLNAYEWCGTHTYNDSGYAALNDQVMDYPVPIFFSETGCNTPEPRLFQDQAAIFGPEMSPYWSGAIIYEWIQEVNQYGLISYGGYTDSSQLISIVPGNVVVSGTPTPVTPDFTNLLNAWKTLSPSSVSEAAYSPTLTPPPCPAYTAGVWQVNGDVSLPTVGISLDVAASSSIDSGASSSPTPTASSNAPPSSASTAAHAAHTSGAASGGKEITGMALGLTGVMLTFVWWL